MSENNNWSAWIKTGRNNELYLSAWDRKDKSGKQTVVMASTKIMGQEFSTHVHNDGRVFSHCVHRQSRKKDVKTKTVSVRLY